MAYPPTDDHGDGEPLLRNWIWMAIVLLLRKAGYRNWAEDVAGDMVADQWAKMRAGSSYRPRGMTLPVVLKREAFRRARASSSLKSIGESELGTIQSPDGTDDEGPLHSELMTVVEGASRPSQVEGMIRASAAGAFRLRDLAAAAGISERTFRNRMRARGVAPR